MDFHLDPVALTRELIAFDTRNPPGNEGDCARFVGGLLHEAGFGVEYHEFAPGRTSIVARTRGASERTPLCFTGHLDVVPLGKQPWQHDPFAGEIVDGLLYGRGAADMKGGIAAMTCAAISAARMTRHRVPLLLVFTASEETGCEGAAYLAGLDDVLGRAGAMVIGEPTGNHPLIAHKGVFWLEAVVRGITAHGSRPELGENAIYRAARAVLALEAFDFEHPEHHLLGTPSLNTGTIQGGLNVNSVPDHAAIGIDMRTVADQDHDDLLEKIRVTLGEDVELKVLQDVRGIMTDEEDPWIQQVFAIMAQYLEEPPKARGISYYTDGSILKPALGEPPTVILGPGEPEQAHVTDEYCRVSDIEVVAEAYREIALSYGE